MGTSRRDGQVAVITGGGRGFGKAFGTALADLGVHVILVDLDGSEAERAAAAICEHGRFARGVQGDVTDESRMTGVMQAASKHSGHLDLLTITRGCIATSTVNLLPRSA